SSSSRSAAAEDMVCSSELALSRRRVAPLVRGVLWEEELGRDSRESRDNVGRLGRVSFFSVGPSGVTGREEAVLDVSETKDESRRSGVAGVVGTGREEVEDW